MITEDVLREIIRFYSQEKIIEKLNKLDLEGFTGFSDWINEFLIEDLNNDPWTFKNEFPRLSEYLQLKD